MSIMAPIALLTIPRSREFLLGGGHKYMACKAIWDYGIKGYTNKIDLTW